MKIYDVGMMYTLDGHDTWTCLSFDQKPGEPAEYWFMNSKTGESKQGTVEMLPEFREVDHVKQAA
jgi:hypothetical protein